MLTNCGRWRGRTRRSTEGIAKHARSRKVEDLHLEGNIEARMERSLVEKINKRDHVQSFQDRLVMAGMHFVRVRYLGGLLVLLTSSEGIDLSEIIDVRSDGWKEDFEEVVLWSPTLSFSQRVPYNFGIGRVLINCSNHLALFRRLMKEPWCSLPLAFLG